MAFTASFWSSQAHIFDLGITLWRIYGTHILASSTIQSLSLTNMQADTLQKHEKHGDETTLLQLAYQQI